VPFALAQRLLKIKRISGALYPGIGGTSLLRNLLQGLHQKLQPEYLKEITRKCASEITHQINNTEGRYQKDQSAGTVLHPRYNSPLPITHTAQIAEWLRLYGSSVSFG
jgi:hypothetical protein